MKKKILIPIIIILVIVNIILISKIFIEVSDKDKDNNKRKLIYTITYNGIDCPTPILYLYSDKTYEYYYTFTTDNKKLTPKTGTYNYDMKNLIENINNYESDYAGPYYVKDENDTKYTTYSSNKELQELLKSIDVKLTTCLVQE